MKRRAMRRRSGRGMRRFAMLAALLTLGPWLRGSTNPELDALAAYGDAHRGRYVLPIADAINGGVVGGVLFERPGLKPGLFL